VFSIEPCIQPFAVRQINLPIAPVFVVTFAFSRVIARIHVRYARGLLAPLRAYSLPIGCYLIAILAQKQRKNTKETAKKRQTNSKPFSKQIQRSPEE
jgi:hypothetical protein